MKKLLIVVACAGMMAGCALPNSQMSRLDRVGGWTGEAAKDGSRGMYRNGLSTHSIHFIQTVDNYPLVIVHAMAPTVPESAIVVDGVKYPATLAIVKNHGRAKEYKLISHSKQDFKGIADSFNSNQQVEVNGITYETGNFSKALQTFFKVNKVN